MIETRATSQLLSFIWYWLGSYSRARELCTPKSQIHRWNIISQLYCCIAVLICPWSTVDWQEVMRVWVSQVRLTTATTCVMLRIVYSTRQVGVRFDGEPSKGKTIGVPWGKREVLPQEERESMVITWRRETSLPVFLSPESTETVAQDTISNTSGMATVHTNLHEKIWLCNGRKSACDPRLALFIVILVPEKRRIQVRTRTLATRSNAGCYGTSGGCAFIAKLERKYQVVTWCRTRPRHAL